MVLHRDQEVYPTGKALIYETPSFLMDKRSTSLVGAVTNRADRERIKEI